MGVAAVFHGSTVQKRALLAAVERNCSCTRQGDTQITGNCPAHQALLDQRFLDGLLFARRLTKRLLAEEQCARFGP